MAHYRTIVLSDIHLGARDSHVKEVIDFLKNNSCEKLILNGDIIDGWKLRRGSKWRKSHTDFWRRVLKISKKTPVIYIKGNHDDFLDHIFPIRIGKIQITDHIIHEGLDGNKYYVTHGDIFDLIVQKSWLKWLAHIGDIGYSLLLYSNRIVDVVRRWQKKPKWSLSLYVKLRVKAAVSYVSDFATNLVELAKQNECQGVICGHIHQPEIKMIDDMVYMNSGDFVENLTALVEDESGVWSIYKYKEEDQEEKNNKKKKDKKLTKQEVIKTLFENYERK